MSELGAHTFEEHTGEVEIHLRAADLAALLAEAGHALAELLIGDGSAGGTPSGPDAAREPVHVVSTDRAALVVDWLNELIYRSETRKRVYRRFQLEVAGEREVRGEIEGFPAEELRTQVKAATLHRLQVQPAPEGMRAVVVLDV